MLYTPPILNQKPLYSIEIKKEAPKEAKPEEYTVVDNDSLEKIASDHHTTPQRLFNKNLDISDPNHIEAGQKLVIPTQEEALQDRPYPSTIEPTPSTSQVAHQVPRGSFSGNTYSFGYCTYGVKTWRPDIPNNWGEAIDWYRNAQAIGWATGSVPKVGAVAWARNYDHVAYVVAVDGSTVTVREENYQGWNVVSTRVTNTSEWLYIY